MVPSSAESLSPAEKKEAAQKALPDDSPEGLVEAAAEGELSGSPEQQLEKEVGALDFLTGATKPLEYDIGVDYATPSGDAKLTFHIRQMDGARILELEDAHTKGSGPFGQIDDAKFNAALVAEATLYLTDASGEQLDLKSEKFRGPVPDAAEAVRIRFKFQSGLLSGVAGQIRAVSGWAPGRVAAAEKAVERAVGG